MASIKVKFRPSTVADREGIIYYQIIQARKVKQITTDYHVYAWEWDESRAMVTTTQKSKRKSLLLSIRERIRWDVERLSKIDRKLDCLGVAYSTEDLIDEFHRYASEYSLANFMEALIVKFRRNDKIRTAETYRAALSSFRKFLASRAKNSTLTTNEDIMLDCLTSDIMESYEAWLHSRGLAPNSISFYTRILRAVYNRAVSDEIITDRNPFRNVYTGVDKTVKRALPLQIIKKIKAIDLSLTPELDYARDIFMLSFFFRGMSFIDMAYLKKSDLRNGVITYRRRKTGQQLQIKWTKEMQRTLDKYPENKSDYLLPIICANDLNARSTYRRVSGNINHSLKRIAAKIGIPINLTLYVARHSWASAAKAKGIPLSVISEGMGHDSESTTQIYLSSLDTSAVDRANALILSAL